MVGWVHLIHLYHTHAKTISPASVDATGKALWNVVKEVIAKDLRFHKLFSYTNSEFGYSKSFTARVAVKLFKTLGCAMAYRKYGGGRRRVVLP